MSDTPAYLLAGQPAELERLQLQSRVWEPAGRALLRQITPRPGLHALELGCGVMGWLRILSEWVGADGRVTGSDLDDAMLAHARALIAAESLANVSLVKDDLFASGLPPAAFDLVHARFQIAPLGRAVEQLGVYAGLVKPGGWIVVEDPDIGSWHVNPDAPAVTQLIALIDHGFRAGGGDFSAGRRLPEWMRAAGLDPLVEATVVALPPGHPYLRLPLQFATSLRSRLLPLAGESTLDDLLARAEQELARPGTWGTTFTLIQARARVPG